MTYNGFLEETFEIKYSRIKTQVCGQWRKKKEVRFLDNFEIRLCVKCAENKVDKKGDS